MNTDSQCQMLLRHFITGGKITGLEAVLKMGIMHLPRRIKDLKDGLYDGLFWPIDSVTVCRRLGRTYAQTKDRTT
jgi:hypothetical protein